MIERTSRLRAEFLAAAQAPPDSWEQRFASRFGLAYAAACLAIGDKIVPWSEEEAMAATVDTYQAARRAIVKFDDVIERAWGAGLRQVQGNPKRVIALTLVTGAAIRLVSEASLGQSRMETGSRLKFSGC